jgi:MATE family multidrug resistance protein
MTEISHARVLRIALPIVIANATIPILGAVDTGVVGQLGAAAPIGAVGLGAIILASLYWVFGFLRMGTTGLVAQAKGAGDGAEVAANLSRALLIGGTAGLALIALQMPLFAAAFRLAPASAEVEALARDYLTIRIWGAPATISMYALTGWLIALERTRAVLAIQLWMNGLNIGLDLGFVLGLGWGVPGVATATLISEWSGLALALWLARDALLGGHWRRAALVFNRARLVLMARVNSDIMIRSVLLQAAFTSFLFLGAGLGDTTLAANQVLAQFLSITAFALDGFAFAAETLTGQALGARQPKALRRAAIVTSKWGVGGALLLAVFFWIFGPRLIDIMATAPEVRATARAYLPWLAAAPLIGIASWMLDGIFIGTTLTREMRNAMLASVALYIAAVMVLLPAFGNHGLWAALMVFNAARGLTMAAYYPRAEARARA